jgi:hypothetical protein
VQCTDDRPDGIPYHVVSYRVSHDHACTNTTCATDTACTNVQTNDTMVRKAAAEEVVFW